MRHLTLLLCLLLGLPARAADVPAISLTTPADGSTTTVAVDAPGFPNVGLGVQFQVTGWAYPAANKGVLFGLDAWRPDQLPLVVAQAAGVAFVSPVSVGQHTLWACLATLNAGLWSPLDLEPGQAGLQPACTDVVVKVAIVDCHPTVWNEAVQGYVCDPAHPEACCLDANPCSIESCEWVAGDDVDHFECRFAPAAVPCCQSDLECPEPGQTCDPETHACTGGEPPPDASEPGPEAVEAEAAPEVSEPAAEAPPEPGHEPSAESVELAAEIFPEPDTGAEVAAAEVLPDPGRELVHADGDPADTSEAATDPAGDDVGGQGDGRGGCAIPCAPAPATAPVVLIALSLLFTTRRRRPE